MSDRDRYNHAMPPREPVIEIIDDEMAAVLRMKTSAERLESVFAMWRFARECAMTIASCDQTVAAEQIKIDVQRRMLGSA